MFLTTVEKLWCQQNNKQGICIIILTPEYTDLYYGGLISL